MKLELDIPVKDKTELDLIKKRLEEILPFLLAEDNDKIILSALSQNLEDEWNDENLDIYNRYYGNK